MKRTIQYQLGLVVLMSLMLALIGLCASGARQRRNRHRGYGHGGRVRHCPAVCRPNRKALCFRPRPRRSHRSNYRRPRRKHRSLPKRLASRPGSLLPTTHVVQPGETLATISVIYGVPVNEIQQANGIADPNALTVGQTLTIPAPGTTVTEPMPPTTGEQVYIVQPGDNLFRIGLNYGFTAAELAAYNGIPDMTRIYVGQEIRIPPR